MMMHSKRRVACLLLAVLLSTVLYAHARPLPFESQLAPGMFLVASRQLRAPSFAKTVILLIDYSAEGALGVIVNRPSPVQVSKVFPDLPNPPSPSPYIYIGGPVSQRQLRLLVRTGEPSEGMQRVLEDVYMSGDPEVLKALLERGDDVPFRAFAGYAGWAPGQLEREIERGGWHIMPAETDAIFNKAPASMWPRLIRKRDLKWL